MPPHNSEPTVAHSLIVEHGLDTNPIFLIEFLQMQQMHTPSYEPFNADEGDSSVFDEEPLCTQSNAYTHCSCYHVLWSCLFKSKKD